ncbi:LysM peptidoglycan-binding domain-containing protein [Cellulomonas edaphi]|uniref:LysM peptidoglycan-binding domain-containing protein n=1 Tax=Cellulomonas edaphi TaxID=3053468 RepID=A0ABT7S8U6_9CELL|nr:LysM peptidoglycan-binding domain-containing protein [Cellulomons edaphi]MDM7832047.1 LysM peptidoglycan-binding domain-containing protein [Cellulomons edaphi]
MSAIAMGPQLRSAQPLRPVRQARPAQPARSAEPAGAARPGVRGLALTHRGRAVVVVVAALMGALVVMLGGQALAEPPASSRSVVEHQVVAGETLWGIAAEAVSPGESVGKAVTEMVRLNNLPSAELMAGQTILVPTHG